MKTDWYTIRKKITKQANRLKERLGHFTAIITGRSGERLRYVIEELGYDVWRCPALHTFRDHTDDAPLPTDRPRVLIDDHVQTGETIKWVYTCLEGNLQGVILCDPLGYPEDDEPDPTDGSWDFAIGVTPPNVLLGNGKYGCGKTPPTSEKDLIAFQEAIIPDCVKDINNLSIKFNSELAVRNHWNVLTAQPSKVNTSMVISKVTKDVLDWATALRNNTSKETTTQEEQT